MTALRERVGSARLGLGSRRVPQLVFVVICLAVGIFVVLPIGALIIQTVYRGHAGFQGLSTYRNVFEQPQIRRALVDTAYLAIGSMALAVPLGAGLAWVISSVNVPFAKYLNVVPLLPMFLPPLVGALGWEFLLSPRPGLLNVMLRAVIPGHQETGPLNIYNLWGIIWVNSLYVTPYVYLIVINAFRQYDSALDDAARVVGSSGAFNPLAHHDTRSASRVDRRRDPRTGHNDRGLLSTAHTRSADRNPRADDPDLQRAFKLSAEHSGSGIAKHGHHPHYRHRVVPSATLATRQGAIRDGRRTGDTAPDHYVGAGWALVTLRRASGLRCLSLLSRPLSVS